MRAMRILFVAAILFVPSAAWAWLPPAYVFQWGSTGSGPGQFGQAWDLAVDGSGNVYVTDVVLGRVQKFDHLGSYLTAWDVPSPSSIAINTNGNVLVANQGGDIREFTPSGTLVRQWAYPHPAGITVDPDGFIYVSDASRDVIDKFSNDGTFVLSWGGPGSTKGLFHSPGDLAYGSGSIFVADVANHRVQRFDTLGNSQGSMGSTSSGSTGPGEVSWPAGLATDASGYLYVTDYIVDRVNVYRGGGFIGTWGSFGTNPGQFVGPAGIGVGSDGSIYVADTNGFNRVLNFGANPVPTENVTLGRVKALYRGAK